MSWVIATASAVAPSGAMAHFMRGRSWVVSGAVLDAHEKGAEF
jgi:hypothetical protein